jgi:hypothetical protein
MSFLFSKEKNGIDLAKDIISEINEKVKRIYWTNEEIDKYFAKRSAIDILRNGTTCFMNPCLDLTLVSASLMSSNEIKHDFIIEEHLPTKEFNFSRLHFVLEFQNEDKEYVLNYKRGNEVQIFEGKYNGRKDIPCAQIIRVSGKEINPEKTLSENIGYNNLEDLIKSKFKGYSLKSNLNRLKQDNSKENYKLYKAKYGEKFNIILEP